MWKGIAFGLALVLSLPLGAQPTQATEATWLPASAEKLPRWRGFNLLEKFSRDWSNGPFKEEDFQHIQELGFNFVRLPMDYRVWIKGDDWRVIDEAVIREIDEAVAWGSQYGIHVCINFHRAPGHTVAEPPEPRDLWTDPEAEEVCAQHWAYFARRYKDIPSERLSFNLFNEPMEISGEDYTRVARMMVDAIRAEDPERLIIADGVRWGSQPCPELIPLGIAQATRGYSPANISHYGATWVDTRDMAYPHWPTPQSTQFLYGPDKGELQAPLVLEGPFSKDVQLRLRVGTVSTRGRLRVAADGVPLWTHTFVCGPGEGEWREAIYKEEWGVYQNRYDRDYVVDIPRDTQRISIVNTECDWLTLLEIGLRSTGTSDDAESVLGLMSVWGEKNAPIRAHPQGTGWTFNSDYMMDQAWLWREHILPWQAIETQGVGVMVGEWGAFNKTPHAVTLRWMEDCLKNWQKAGWGWALWNFRGSFGVLDSDRRDVDYESWRGHQLDRKMLELLQRY